MYIEQHGNRDGLIDSILADSNTPRNIDIAKYRFVYGPMYSNKSHFELVVADVANRMLHFIDPLGSTKASK